MEHGFPLLPVHAALFMRLLAVTFFVFDLITGRGNVEPIGTQWKKHHRQKARYINY